MLKVYPFYVRFQVLTHFTRQYNPEDSSEHHVSLLLVNNSFLAYFQKNESGLIKSPVCVFVCPPINNFWTTW
jgi:hypothetical protein